MSSILSTCTLHVPYQKKGLDPPVWAGAVLFGRALSKYSDFLDFRIIVRTHGFYKL